MKNSKLWWEETKNDEVKLHSWLKRQYTGEVTASGRIDEFSERYVQNEGVKRTLKIISEQEKQHAEWVKSLLDSRGIDVEVVDPHDRYWSATLPAVQDMETAAAVAAHAESMRLERINVIAHDVSAPEDIRSTFSKILKDERFHAKAFKFIAGPKALAETLPDHQRGRELLGLEP